MDGEMELGEPKGEKRKKSIKENHLAQGTKTVNCFLVAWREELGILKWGVLDKASGWFF